MIPKHLEFGRYDKLEDLYQKFKKKANTKFFIMRKVFAFDFFKINSFIEK